MVKVNPRLVTMITLAIGIAVIIVSSNKVKVIWNGAEIMKDADGDIIIPVSLLPNKENLRPTNWDRDGVKNGFNGNPKTTFTMKILNGFVAIALELLPFTHFWSSS